jgi:hypothetical protein
LSKADGGVPAKSDRPGPTHIPDTVAEIPGLGPIRVRALEKAGLGTIAALSAASFETLMTVPGLTEIKVRHIMSYLSGAGMSGPIQARPRESVRPQVLYENHMPPPRNDGTQAPRPKQAPPAPERPIAPAPEQAHRPQQRTEWPVVHGQREAAAQKEQEAAAQSKKLPATTQPAAPQPPASQPESAAAAPQKAAAERKPLNAGEVSAFLDEVTHARRQIAALLTGPHAVQFRKPLAHALTHCIGALQHRRLRQEAWEDEPLARARRQLHRVLGALAGVENDPAMKKKAQSRIAEQIDSATDRLLECCGQAGE